jgi:SAM-dependent methyltransferase
LSTAEREKWDERYRAGSYEGRTHPTALLEQWAPRLGGRGRALDVACGTGRNALWLAEHGYAVDALDISTVGLERARAAARSRAVSVNWIAADLDDPERALPDERYDLIVWVRYVNPRLMTALIARLAPGGVLLCEQHLESTLDVVGPKTAGFRLRPNELRDAASGLTVLHYYEGPVVDPDGRTAALAQLIARRGV